MPTNTYVALKTTTVSTSTASVTFDLTGISGYTDLVLIGQYGATVTESYLLARFNSDSSTNYSTTSVYGNGSSALSGRSTNQTALYIDWNVSCENALTTNSIVNIMNYSNTTTYKNILIRNNRTTATTPTYTGAEAQIGVWRKTPEAITSIVLSMASGNILAGSTFSLYGIAAASVGAKATGGTIYSDSEYYYHVFGSTGTFTPLSSLTADVLVVAGGGGGNDGGGGAGGIAYFASSSLTATGYTATVGGGGAGSSGGAGGNGFNSSFGALIAASGGGGGAAYNTGNGIAGGSGGGAPRSASTSTTGGASNQSSSGTTAIYGSAGGAYVFGGTNGGGGGGGAGGVGATNNAGSTGGAGTNAFLSWMTATGLGVSGLIAGGGGAYANPTQALGSAGGGNGSTNSLGATSGLANTGSGGGGAAGGGSSTGNGGSGIVVVRYLKA